MQILLVEDTPEQAQIVECYIEMAIPDAQITKTGSLSETVSVLGKQNFDAILLDLGLPDAQGIETVSEVHKIVVSTPIVVLTSAGEDGLGILCLQAGAHDFLEKASVTPLSLEKALSFASARKSEEINLCIQRELDSISVLNPDPIRDFGSSEKLVYQAYLVAGDGGLEAAQGVVRNLIKIGIKSRAFLSLHSVAMEELAQRLPPERLRHVAAQSSYLALAVMTVVAQLLSRKKQKLAV